MSRQIVKAFLSALEDRDLSRAKAFLAPGFTMTFPSGVCMHQLEELVAWAGNRYRFVNKRYDRFDEFALNGRSIVYCFGTLSGETQAGRAITGVRFIDRFELHGDRITDQRVWNDLGEALRDL